MTPEEAARIVNATTFPFSGSLDGWCQTHEAFLIHVDGLSSDEAHERAERYRAAYLKAQGIDPS